MNQKDKMMVTLPVWQLIPRLTIPTVIITLVMVIYNMADIFFIGQTGSSQMVNAVALCMPIFTIVQAFGTLIGGGGSTAISISLGKNDVDSARRISVFCCWFGLLLGIVIAIACNLFAPQIVRVLGASEAYAYYAEMYLRIISLGSAIMIFSNAFVNIVRADGSAKESMIANLTGTAVNIILDPVFILGFQWGIAGAAAATVLGNLATMLFILLRLKKHSAILSFRIKDFRMSSREMKVLILGLPLASGTLLMSISYMVMNNLLSTYGDNATGAFGIARSVMMLSTLTQMGICMGMQPAMSYNFGRGDLRRVREIIRKTAIVTFVLGTVVSVICILFRSPILHAFIDNDEVYKYAGVLLIGCMISSPVYGIFQLSAALLQAVNKPSWGTMVTVVRHGIVFIPAMLLLNLVFGYRGLAFAIPVTDICAAVLGIILSLIWLGKIEKSSMTSFE